jgi:hypothetical protein
MTLNKIALGGGATEAVCVQSFIKVEQGYVASIGDNGSF